MSSVLLRSKELFRKGKMLLIKILNNNNLNIAKLSIVTVLILPILTDFSRSPGLSRISPSITCCLLQNDLCHPHSKKYSLTYFIIPTAENFAVSKNVSSYFSRYVLERSNSGYHVNSRIFI